MDTPEFGAEEPQHPNQATFRPRGRGFAAPELARSVRRKRKMKTQVEFRSDKFPPYDGEEEQINPGLWGKRLAEYLQENLTHQGLKVTSIGAEDWG